MGRADSASAALFGIGAEGAAAEESGAAEAAAGNGAAAGGETSFSAARNRSVPLMLFSFESQRAFQVAAIEKVEATSDPSFTVSRDGRWVAWAQFDRFESNLMMIEDFR